MTDVTSDVVGSAWSRTRALVFASFLPPIKMPIAGFVRTKPAIGILMGGRKDAKTNARVRDQALPTTSEVTSVISALSHSNPLTSVEIARVARLKNDVVVRILKYLSAQNEPTVVPTRD